MFVCVLCVLTYSQLTLRWIDHTCWLSWLIMRCLWWAGSIAHASQLPPCPYASSMWTRAQTSTPTPNRSNWKRVFHSGRCWRLLRHTIQTDSCSRVLSMKSHTLASLAFLMTFCVKASTHFTVRWISCLVLVPFHISHWYWNVNWNVKLNSWYPQ